MGSHADTAGASSDDDAFYTAVYSTADTFDGAERRSLLHRFHRLIIRGATGDGASCDGRTVGDTVAEAASLLAATGGKKSAALITFGGIDFTWGHAGDLATRLNVIWAIDEVIHRRLQQPSNVVHRNAIANLLDLYDFDVREGYHSFFVFPLEGFL